MESECRRETAASGVVSAGFQHFAQRADARPFPDSRFGQFRCERTVTSTSRAHLDGVKLQAVPARVSAARRAAASGSIAHQHAQIGVFPVLDAAGAAGHHARKPRTPAP